MDFPLRPAPGKSLKDSGLYSPAFPSQPYGDPQEAHRFPAEMMEDAPIEEARKTTAAMTAATNFTEQPLPIFVRRAAYEDMPSESSFLSLYPRGTATLTFPGKEHSHESITGINMEYFNRSCPVLAMAFESSRSGPRLSTLR